MIQLRCLILILFFTIQSDLLAEENALPNIILCMADDQGWGDVGYMGHPDIKTPVLDEMSRTCLRFDHFYSAAPVCSPTRASVLTGRHPNRSRTFSWGHELPPQEWTIAEALKEKGYTTAHFGKWHLGSVTSQSPCSPGKHGFEEWFSAPNFFELHPWLSHQGNPIKTEGEGSEVIVSKAVQFMRNSIQKKKPFFTVIWFGSPHTPHIALEKDRKPYQHLSKKEQNYLGEITAMDRSIGQLRSELKTMGIQKNTLLWFTSDNGSRPPGSTGGLSGKKGELWEGGIRVPAIIEWPEKITRPGMSDIPCSTVDILPTLLDIVQIQQSKAPHLLDGVSLYPLIRNEEIKNRKPLGFWKYPAKGKPRKSDEILEKLSYQLKNSKQDLSQPDWKYDRTVKYSSEERPGHAAWIDGAYKLHRIPKKSGKIEYRLFNLEKDSKEQSDLSQIQPEILDKMKADLKRWQKSVVHSMNGNDYHN
jgi:arylsulfatase